MIGTILGNRYEILEKIGGGGMALVYKARCHWLDRIVAVKVLRPQFIHDEDFIRRFRREAQAAASLSHPNIVNIYDVGKEGEIYYIVMELVEGETLKEKIAREAPFKKEELLKIAMQIAEALNHAHQNHIIHRDIKPHNILITPDGRVKVTDFGIARAISSNTLTQTGSVLGSVHYFSPEQARGGFIGEKSDLYSLGVVMYEMACGQLPFEGESPIAVALKHLQEEVVPPGKINPEVKGCLENIILKAIEKDLDNRYQTAKEMIRDMEICLAGGTVEYRPAKLDSPTLVIPAIRDEDLLVKNKEWEREKPISRRKKRKSRGWFVFFVLLFLLAGFIGGLYLLQNYLVVPNVEVPDFTGLTLSQVEERARLAGVNYTVKGEEFSNTVPVNHVISQVPEAHAVVKKGKVVELVMSKGEELILIPDVVKKSQFEAQTMIEQANLSVGDIKEEYNDTIPEGYVIEQNPTANIRVSRGTAVNLTVSLGKKPEQFVLPDFVGKDVSVVQEELAKLNLYVVKTEYTYDNQWPQNTVIATFPTAGTLVKEGDGVSLLISRGPEPATPSSDSAGEAGTVSSSAVKEQRFRISFDVGPKEQQVKLVVVDQGSEQVVYEKTHQRSDPPVEVTVRGSSGAKVRLYVNGDLVAEKKI